MNYYQKKKINIITNTNPKLFNTERITRRFEDLHMTPEEFLNKNFTKEEIEIMIKNANYFKLNKQICYLETNSNLNVPIYEHFGFKVLEKCVIPNTNVEHYAMLFDGK